MYLFQLTAPITARKRRRRTDDLPLNSGKGATSKQAGKRRIVPKRIVIVTATPQPDLAFFSLFANNTHAIRQTYEKKPLLLPPPISISVAVFAEHERIIRLSTIVFSLFFISMLLDLLFLSINIRRLLCMLRYCSEKQIILKDVSMVFAFMNWQSSSKF